MVIKRVVDLASLDECRPRLIRAPKQRVSDGQALIGVPRGRKDQLTRLGDAHYLRQKLLGDRLRFSQPATGGKEPGQRTAAVIHAERA
jgi:hypothetical protein